MLTLTWTRTIEWDLDDWRNRSACRDTDPDLFFPVGTTGLALDQIAAAKAVCAACDVQAACLEFALATNQESGDLGRHLRGGTPQTAQGLARPPAPRRLIVPRLVPRNSTQFRSRPPLGELTTTFSGAEFAAHSPHLGLTGDRDPQLG